MSERRGDQGTPLYPRRTLSGPTTTEEPTPVDTPARPEASAPQQTAADPAASADGDGPPTASMARVDDRPADGDAPAARVPGPAMGAAAGATPAGSSPMAPAASRGAEPSTDSAAKPRRRPPRKPPRKARLRAVRLDPWSVMKMAFALSIALAIVTVVAVFIVWTVLDSAGVWDSINASVDSVVNSDDEQGFDIRQWVGRSRVMSVTLLVSVANVVLLTALATLAAFVYNLAAALLGGFEVTLAEDR